MSSFFAVSLVVFAGAGAAGGDATNAIKQIDPVAAALAGID